jgi:hypothetical protein
MKGLKKESLKPIVGVMKQLMRQPPADYQMQLLINKRASETPIQTATRLASNASRMQQARAEETPVRRSARLADQAERQAEYRARMDAGGQIAQRAANQARGGQRLAATYRVARRQVVEADVTEHYLGPMDQVCEECGSLNFNDERTSGDRNRFTLCCQKGFFFNFYKLKHFK